MSFWEGGGAAIGGSIVGGLLANQLSKDNAREQMRWQERLSNSAHQREVQDLRAAGLNPILSAMKGQGASTPAGSAAPVVDAIGAGVTSGLEAKKLKQELQAIDSQTALNKLTGEAARAGAVKDLNSAKQAAAQTKLLEAQTPAAIKHGKYDSEAAGIDAVTKRLLNGAQVIEKFIPGKKMQPINLPPINLPSKK